MKNLLTRPLFHVALLATSVGGMLAWSGQHNTLEASSHREAPLIADDPLADNTDLYAFRSPEFPGNDANAAVTIIANYIPLELPQGGPNYNTFGENVRYEIHIKNGTAGNAGDDITYRFTFTRTNQDPTTFFNIRLGQQNLKTTYICEKSTGGGAFSTIVSNGIVPPPNVGPRSITSAAGLNTTYATLMTNAIQTLADGTKIFCGPTDDPFFADLGGIFDLGGIRAPGSARDGLARKNTHAIAMQIPVSLLKKASAPALTGTTNILDSNYIIGVWASASRPSTRVLSATGAAPTTSGNYVQVSRIGMPLLNEVINPIGAKDAWNAGSPYAEVAATDDYLSNPELGLYMADNVPVAPTAPKPAGQTYYGEAVPGLGPLRIQSKSLAGQALLGGSSFAGFDFRNGAAGVSALAGTPLVAGTALAPLASGGYGEYLLRPGKPRSVDILPIFHTGVPNAIPYQLATGKAGNPLAAGKPFINNFLLVGASASNPGGDMLRLNMAVQPTARNSADFSSDGLLAAAVLGLTDSRYNASNALQAIPNMDGFPNGRRLEDDVTRIELKAVGGVVLAAIGLWYDDYTPSSTNPVTAQLGRVLGFNAGVSANDTTFRASFPYVQTPWSGTNAQRVALAQRSAGLGLSPNLTVAQAFPNPFVDRTTLHFELPTRGTLSLVISDAAGRRVATVAKDKAFAQGVNELTWTPGRDVAPGQYIATLYNGSTVVQSVRIERQ
ncbi:DUF4331 domain-containing protein [Hymenobacter armeniacus]|uniref:DUF4331 domain-containing protein n=1 Tax=Hymenobacter armeniacus TaxID=2771358 RepID=A0ABR8JWJ6_9BACT|nr:DUF4331 domain-containing protein [Hymenobacter armeniacus]MBD2723281.1 DUF4331 domain-containing protein [Hymenobacter armeniacus]